MLAPVKFVEPIRNDATAMQKQMASGHLNRTGHTQDASLVSADGRLWHRVRHCCGDTIPSQVPTWEEATAPTPYVHTGFEAGAL